MPKSLAPWEPKNENPKPYPQKLAPTSKQALDSPGAEGCMFYGSGSWTFGQWPRLYLCAL